MTLARKPSGQSCVRPRSRSLRPCSRGGIQRLYATRVCIGVCVCSSSFKFSPVVVRYLVATAKPRGLNEQGKGKDDDELPEGSAIEVEEEKEEEDLGEDYVEPEVRIFPAVSWDRNFTVLHLLQRVSQNFK